MENKFINQSKKFDEKIFHSSRTFYSNSQAKTYTHRLKNVRLKWCKQVVKILIKNHNFTKNLKINDIGCNYFQFYKELKLRNLKCDYLGYDHDKRFLDIGLNKFPELKNKFHLADIEKVNQIRNADITVISALLEHLNKPTKVLNLLIQNTKKCLILRTPVSKTSSFNLIEPALEHSGYLFNVFGKKVLENLFSKNRFAVNFHTDIFTQISSNHFVKKDKIKKKNTNY